jgi:integrase
MPTPAILTDKSVKAAIKAAVSEARARRISDGSGLYLDARPNGSGWWRLRYWIGGKEGMLSLGTYPDTSLKAARERRDQAREQVSNGINPSAARKADKQARDSQEAVARILADGGAFPGSFEAVAREWLVTVHGYKVTPGHAKRTSIRLEQMVFPYLGAMPIGDIEAPHLLQCLRRIEARGVIETAHRVKDACGQVFRYGIAAGHCQRNPAADLRDALRPVPERHHAAIVDPKRGGELLRDMTAYQGHPVTCAALHLSVLLMLRPGELRHMEWSWIDFDDKTLTVPAETMKRNKAEKANGVPHAVPLASQALTVLRGLQAITGHGRYVFPSLLTGERCMSENTVRGALRRMGYGNDDMTAHGFRAMARTMIAERLGVAPEVIEAQLAHAVAGSLGRAYDRTQYLDQRRDMMDRWADYLDRLRDSSATISPPRAEVPA